MDFWIIRENFRRWIPTVSLVENLEVRLVVLNNLIVFEMFNATNPREFSHIILQIKRVNKSFLKVINFLNIKFQNHFEPIFKSNI